MSDSKRGSVRAKASDAPVCDLAEAKEDATDLVAELGEVALDTFLAEGPLKDVPILGTALKGWRGYRSIRDYVFARKVEEFTRNSPSISSSARADFAQRIKRDPAFRKKTAEHLVIVLERLDDLEKAPYLARILAAMVEQRITPDEMRRLCSILDRSTVSDLRVLRDVVGGRRQLTRAEFHGLEAIGLAAIQHSLIRPLSSEDLNGTVDFAGTSLQLAVNPIARLFVESAF